MQETMMTYIHEEPQVCHDIIAQAADRLAAFTELMREKQPKNWLVLATGSSANAMLSAKYYMEKTAGVSIEIQEPFNFVHYEKVKPSIDFVLAVSQSGHSYSTIEAVKKVHAEGKVATAVLTSNLDSPITAHADSVIDIGCGVEKVGFVTKGFTATVLTSMLMAIAAGTALGELTTDAGAAETAKLTRLIEQIPAIIEKTESFYTAHAAELTTIPRFALIGYGPTVGTAKEGETKFTETVRVPTQGFELEAFMHGPYLEVNSSYGLIFIKTNSPLAIRTEMLKDYLGAYTTHCFSLSTGADAVDVKTLSLDVDADEWLSPLLLAIPLQILSYRIASGRGIDLSVRIFDDFDKVLKSKV
ncbi:SIS domain-containing protein [Bacillus rubiinfantis]|uniref:SIS domain-containing protein n=1 Tax=Bacillus rubiinfantis TaxID=1499680 RepID=UPI000A9B0F8D|nr:SIS domain-containing protein [Bacillus rubiinfantis]